MEEKDDLVRELTLLRDSLKELRRQMEYNQEVLENIINAL